MIETGFSATHHIRLHNGTTEPSHGHDWRVRAVFERPSLDSLGMVIDFADARRVLKQVVEQLDYTDLNEAAPFRGKNPTTEVVAEWIFQRVVELGVNSVVRIELTEAPGCTAVYERGPSGSRPTA